MKENRLCCFPSTACLYLAPLVLTHMTCKITQPSNPVSSSAKRIKSYDYFMTIEESQWNNDPVKMDFVSHNCKRSRISHMLTVNA
jgi:hypothetical protein